MSIKQHGFAVAEGEAGTPLASSVPSDRRAMRALGVCFLCLILAGLCIAVSFTGVFGSITTIGGVIAVGEITTALWYWRTFWVYQAGEAPRSLGDDAQAAIINNYFLLPISYIFPSIFVSALLLI